MHGVCFPVTEGSKFASCFAVSVSGPIIIINKKLYYF